jgi:hypothetical protein
MQCRQCTAASNCYAACVDSSGGTDYCFSYACGNDPCSGNATTAIEARRNESPAWSCPATLYPLQLNGVTGYYRNCSQGRIVWSVNTCAQRMPAGTIYNRYFVDAYNANVRQAVGFPLSPPDYGNASGSQRFEYGYLATNPTGLAAIVGGVGVPARERDALVAKWTQAIPGKLPAHDTVWLPGRGAYFMTTPYQGYDLMFTVKAGASAAFAVGGEIQNRYDAMGRWDSWLGWPASDEQCLDVPCKYRYSNFEAGHIRWSAGPDRAYVAKPIAGAIPSKPREILIDPDLENDTFAFRLSRSLKAEAGDPDSDQDGLDDDAEKQLSFLAAPRIFWDEGETCSENQDFIKYRRLDMVQVRPTSPNVSRWDPAQGLKWLTIRFMMAFPGQYPDGIDADTPIGHKSHIGDAEMFEVRLFSARGGLAEWRVGEIVFPPHGGDGEEDLSTTYYQYYGDVGVLARRAALLGTAHLWVAVDENTHGTWGGSEIDSEECKGGGIKKHDCFSGKSGNSLACQLDPSQSCGSGSLRDSLVEGDYWWFDPTRDIGEPEALRYEAWPVEERGSSTPPYVGLPVVPQIKREPNNPNAAYIVNNTGYGVAREYILYREASPEIGTAKRFCGWRCPERMPDGACAPYPYNGFPEGATPINCDGGGAKFPNVGFTTTLYGQLYPVAAGFYRSGALAPDDQYQHADFAYQLWGNSNILPLSSGNVANRFQYHEDPPYANATSTWSASYGEETVHDGDRKGTGWTSGGGGWSSAAPASTAAPQSIRIAFAAARRIRRIDVFTVQNDPQAPADPTPATLANVYGIRDYQVQYCSAALATLCAPNADQNWTTLATVTGNNRAWRTHLFAPVDVQAVRIKVTGAWNSYARITEIETWE